MRQENRIDYVEIPFTDLHKARDFFSTMFGWSFQEWGDDYMSFNDGQLDGGFTSSILPGLNLQSGRLNPSRKMEHRLWPS